MYRAAHIRELIAQEHDHTTSRPGFKEERGQDFDFIAAPPNLQLFAFEKVIIDCVDDDPDDPPARGGDLVSDIRCKAGITGLVEAFEAAERFRVGVTA